MVDEDHGNASVPGWVESRHAIRMIEHGLILVREGSQQLRNLGVSVSNPLADFHELGRTADIEAMEQPVKVVERHDVHRGARNSDKAGRPSGRPKPRGVK